jgi:hypothetical protein
MLQLPFYFKQPEQALVAGLVAALLFGGCAFGCDRNVCKVRTLVDVFLKMRMGSISETRRYPIFRGMLYGFSILFLLYGMFGALVVSGILVNGEPPPLPTLEEFKRMHQLKAKE